MSTSFLVTILEWLQEQFIKNSNKAKERANEQLRRIRELEEARKATLQEASVAAKLATKIDSLLSD